MSCCTLVIPFYPPFEPADDGQQGVTVVPGESAERFSFHAISPLSVGCGPSEGDVVVVSINEVLRWRLCWPLTR